MFGLQAEEYRDDPLIFHGGIKAKLAVALLNCMEWVQSHMGQITLPVLALQGEMDTLVLNTSAQFAYDSVSSKDKELQVCVCLCY